MSSLLSLTDSDLPVLTESFVRGDELHLIMPHSNQIDAGLELVLMVIQANDECFILETTLSLQTQSLDAYPGIRMTVLESEPLAASILNTTRLFTSHEASSRETEPLSLSIFVDQRDQSSIRETTVATPTIEFFGDFMEKGVIRKAQPWWVWSRPQLRDSQVREFAESLSKRPLPLAS